MTDPLEPAKTAIPNPRSRSPIPITTMVRVFFRDRWLCRWCGRPTIFAPALKYLALMAKDRGMKTEPAWYHAHFRRDAAPLLDEQAAVIDRHTAHSAGGGNEEEDLWTACNMCNMQKCNAHADAYEKGNPIRRIKGRYGEPTAWDGLSSLFVLLADDYRDRLTVAERAWLKALRLHSDGKAE